MIRAKELEGYAWQFVDADGHFYITNVKEKIPKHHSSLKKLVYLNDDAVVLTSEEYQTLFAKAAP